VVILFFDGDSVARTHGSPARVLATVALVPGGAAPAALPVSQPLRFGAAAAERTARALGVANPRELLPRADRVIR
jgi:hypothetical protein